MEFKTVSRMIDNPIGFDIESAYKLVTADGKYLLTADGKNLATVRRG